MARPRILVVDDDPGVAQALLMVLEDAGYSGGHAPHGAAALGWLEANGPPDLMLVDLMMPLMNGQELLGRLRDDSRWADIPVLVITAANARVADVPVLHKPVRLEVLLDALTTTLRMREMRAREEP